LLAFSASEVVATCYHPDGSVMTGLAYEPCNQFVGTFSPCCGTNHTGKVAPDICLANGLCQNTGDNVYWRQGCTDKTWKSPFCVDLCITAADGGSANVNVPVGQCSDGSWCCGGVNATCCNAKQGVFLAATVGVSSTLSSTTNPTSTATSKPKKTSTAIPDPSNGLNTGAKAGIGIGVALGILAIAGLLVFVFVKRRRAEKATRAPNMTQDDHAGVAYHEVDGTKKPAEVAANRSPVEAPAYSNPPVEAPANTYRAELPS